MPRASDMSEGIYRRSSEGGNPTLKYGLYHKPEFRTEHKWEKEEDKDPSTSIFLPTKR